MYKIEQIIHEGFELYALYMDDRIVGTYWSEYAAANRIFQLLKAKPRVIVEYNTIDYSQLK